MPGVSRDFVEHFLDVSKTAKPIKQKLRRFARDRKEVIRVEVTKLLAAGFIKEVYNPEWLANPVLVQKKNKEWRMCIDYTDLNKHCPKHAYHLPRIDEIVDSTAGCDLLSFLDCYSGYHQIALYEPDQTKTSFITPFGAYCYTTMSFGLKNAGATYQRAITTCLSDEISAGLAEAYVDDVVVKTKEASSLVDNLKRVFIALNKYQWKLNPTKCIFGVPSGQLLGNVVSRDGIRPSPEKVQNILDLQPPQCVKDVQKLAGCMAALSRFISRLGEKGLPFFRLLKAQDTFVWSDEANQAFTQLKEYLTSPPVLTAPRENERMLLYIAATYHVVSTVFVVEREEPGHTYGVQRPVYYISEVLNESKQRYNQIQKLIYALLITKRKLLHYFHAHPITVMTDTALGDVLRNKDASGRIVKWALELSEYNIEFKSRSAIKSQSLADFIVEWTEITLPPADTSAEHWTMYFDGSLNIDGAGAGVYFKSPSEDELRYVIRLHFPASNNAAEYEACLAGLRIAIELGIKRLLVYGDSALVINQLNKDWDCNHEKMEAYVAEIRKLENKFYGLEYVHVVRGENKIADELSKLGSSRADLPPGVFVEDLIQPSITPVPATPIPSAPTTPAIPYQSTSDAQTPSPSVTATPSTSAAPNPPADQVVALADHDVVMEDACAADHLSPDHGATDQSSPDHGTSGGPPPDHGTSSSQPADHAPAKKKAPPGA